MSLLVLLATGLLNDLYSYNSTTVMWTALGPNGTAPSQRTSMGFAATPDGTIYVFGGSDGGKKLSRGRFEGNRAGSKLCL